MSEQASPMPGVAEGKAKGPVVEMVTMEDGRVVGFAGKRKLLKETIVADGKAQVRLDFRNGQTRLYTVPESLLLQHAAHGASQKLGDKTADLEDVDDMVLAVDELIEQLYDGKWTAERQGGSGMAGTSILFRALVEHTGKTPDAIKAYLSTKTPAEKQALRGLDKLKPIIERLEREKAEKNKVGEADRKKLEDELASV